MPETKPQGVAQETIARLEQEHREGRTHLGLAVGARRLHAELSAEARAVLAEWDAYVERVLDGGGVAHEVLAEGYGERRAVRAAFDRLGLTLITTEDQDGEAE